MRQKLINKFRTICAIGFRVDLDFLRGGGARSCRLANALAFVCVFLFSTSAWAFISYSNSSVGQKALAEVANLDAYKLMAERINSVEGGYRNNPDGTKSAVGGDYYFVNSKGNLELAGRGTNKPGQASQCPAGVTCLPLSWGANQNNMSNPENARIAAEKLGLPPPTAAQQKDPVYLTKLGQNCAEHATCGRDMALERNAINFKNAEEFMEKNGIPKTPENYFIYGEAYNFSSCDAAKYGADRCAAFFKKVEELKQKIANGTIKIKTTVSSDGTVVITGTDQDGKQVGPQMVVHCPNLDLSKALEKAKAYYGGNTMARAYDAWAQMTNEEARSSRQNYYGDSAKKFCIDSIVGDYFSILRKLLSGVSAIEQMLLALVDQLLNMACEYAVTAINNALASICIPLPSLNLDLGLGGGGLEKKTCDGVSLADAIGVARAGSSLDDLSMAVTGSSYKPFLPSSALGAMLRDPPKQSTAGSSSSTVKN